MKGLMRAVGRTPGVSLERNEREEQRRGTAVRTINLARRFCTKLSASRHDRLLANVEGQCQRSLIQDGTSFNGR